MVGGAGGVIGDLVAGEDPLLAGEVAGEADDAGDGGGVDVLGGEGAGVVGDGVAEVPNAEVAVGGVEDRWAG